MRKKKLIYIAMPYTAETPEGIARNIENARRFVRENFPSDSELLPVIPHNAGIGVEGLGGESYWYDATESLMLACSAVVLGPGWRSSRGARNEFEAAQRAKIPVVEAQLVGDGLLVERLRAVTAPRDRKLGDMTLTAILDNQQLRERVLRRMIPVFHTQITERCPSVVLTADTRDLAWPLLHAISSVQQLREVSTDTLDAKQLHTECLDYITGNVDLYPEFQLVQESPGRSLTDDEAKRFAQGCSTTDVSDTLDREIIGDPCPGCCSCGPCFGPKPCRRVCDGSGVLPARKIGSK